MRKFYLILSFLFLFPVVLFAQSIPTVNNFRLLDNTSGLNVVSPERGSVVRFHVDVSDPDGVKYVRAILKDVGGNTVALVNLYDDGSISHGDDSSYLNGSVGADDGVYSALWLVPYSLPGGVNLDISIEAADVLGNIYDFPISVISITETCDQGSTCNNVGEFRCNGQVIEQCVLSGTCNYWQLNTDCGTNICCGNGLSAVCCGAGQICSSSDACIVCDSVCNGACNDSGCVQDPDCNNLNGCCGDNVCDVGECSNCANDCGVADCCNNGTCDSVIGEDSGNCLSDCPCLDLDNDGHDDIACGGDDCDNNDPKRYPGNPEICDGIDNDCDPLTTDENICDNDHDDFCDCSQIFGTGSDLSLVCSNTNTSNNYWWNQTCDCNDGDGNVNGNIVEDCFNTIDDDCDGDIDSFDTDCGGTGIPSNPVLTISPAIATNGDTVTYTMSANGTITYYKWYYCEGALCNPIVNSTDIVTGDNPYSISGIASGPAVWNFMIQACSDNGCSASSNIENLVINSLSVPTNVSLSITPNTAVVNDNITYDWSAGNGPEYYEMQSQYNNEPWSNWLYLGDSTVLSLTEPVLAAGVFKIIVRACNNAGCGYSAVRTLTVGGGGNNPPDQVVFNVTPAVVDVGQNTTYTWSANNADYFDYVSRVNNGTWGNWVSLDTTPGPGSLTSSADNSGVYEFQARACNTIGCTNSNIAPLTVNVPNAVTPTNAQIVINPPVVEVGQNINFSLSATGNPTYYEFYECEGIGCNPVYSANLNIAQNPYLFNGSKNLIGTYRYMITACNTGGCSLLGSIQELRVFALGTCDTDNDGYLDIICNGNDCDDDNPDMFPSNPEICDGLDNDCDPLTLDENLCDNDHDDYCDCLATVVYGSDLSLVCSNTNTSNNSWWNQTCDCDDVVFSVNPGAQEICQGQDDNCDNVIDEGCSCLNNAQQSCGSDIGECVSGTQTCVNGSWGACVGEVAPIAEICDGLDNDCEGNDDQGLIAPLNSNQNGVCNGSHQICVGVGGWQDDYSNILFYEPLTETLCDALDNNCDNTVDENCTCIHNTTQPCGSDVGECQQGTQTCLNGSWGGCIGEILPQAEICDGLDNDCEGNDDQGLFPPLNDNQNGVCNGSQKVCGGISGWQNDYNSILNYEAVESLCSDGFDNDCDMDTDSNDTDCIIPDTIIPTVDSFHATEVNNQASVSWTVSDTGGSHLDRIEVWRAPYDAVNCINGNEGTCVWAEVNSLRQTITTQNTDSNTNMVTDSPGNGTWWYGIHAVDQAGNMGTEGSPAQVVINLATCTDNDDDDYSLEGGGNCCGITNDQACSIAQDCNDDLSNNGVHCYPGNLETCDNYDNNCDTQTDEGCDDDSDNYCDSSMLFYNFPVVACPSSNLLNGQSGDDCDDANINVKPGVNENCFNGADDDCDGDTDGADSDCNTTCTPDACNGICPANCVTIDDPDCGANGCCGDGTCDAGENLANCLGDCLVTGFNGGNFGGNLQPYGVNRGLDVPGSLPAFASIFANTGMEVTRFDVFWGLLEPQNGTYDWTRADDLIGTVSADTEIMFSVFSSSDWGSSRNYCRDLLGTTLHGDASYYYNRAPSAYPNNLQDYMDFLQDLVNRYQGRVKYWMIDNEVHSAIDQGVAECPLMSPFWLGTKEEYIDLLQNSYTAIKQTDPTATVLSSSFMKHETNEEFTNYILEEGKGYFDVLPINLYKCPVDDIDRIKEMRRKMNSFGYEVPIWISETGELDINCHTENIFRTSFDSAEEYKIQSEELIKRHTLAFAADVKKVMRLRIKPYAPLVQYELPTSYVAHFGLTNDIYGNEERPVYYTYQLMTQKLSNFTTIAKIDEGVFRYEFSSKPPVYVAWSDTGNRIIDLSSYITSNQINIINLVTELDISDNPIYPVDIIESTNAINIDETPVFIEELITSDTQAPTVTTFTATGNSGNADIFWDVSDTGGSYLDRIEVWRAPDNGGVPGTWAEVNSLRQTITALNTNNDTNTVIDSPGNGTWWYGIYVVDQAIPENIGYEPTPPGAISVVISSSCVTDGLCNGICPNGCTLAQDPDCGCQDNDNCCGPTCSNANDNNCGVLCGNTVCDSGEDCINCGIDCGICPNPCGDGICDEGCGECVSCPQDCYCGDNYCGCGEAAISCPGDCGGPCGQEEVDDNQDGIFSVCGCSNCNGCLCDVDSDSIADGVCVENDCDVTAPVALDCEISGCNSIAKNKDASLKIAYGWACDENFSSFINNYFTQDGLGALDSSWNYFCADSINNSYVAQCSHNGEFRSYISDNCSHFSCGDGTPCDNILNDGNFNPTGTCWGGNCVGPLPGEERVDADFDGSCEVKVGGCNNDCNGCLCSVDSDPIADGVCVGEECIISGPVAFDCGVACDSSDIVSSVFSDCDGNEGLACYSLNNLLGKNYFTQDGICTEPKLLMTDNMPSICSYTSNHVCQNNGKYYSDGCGGNCGDSDVCDSVFSGNFDSTYGTCSGNTCIPNICTKELVDVNQDSSFSQCGCNSLSNGFVCDMDGDLLGDGLCANSVCVVNQAVSMLCWNNCGTEDVVVYQGCDNLQGLSCDNDFITGGQTFFEQDGLCAEVNGAPDCVSSGHVCKASSGVVYDDCSDCNNGDWCDAVLDDGDIDLSYGVCNGGFCQQNTIPVSFNWNDHNGEDWMSPVKNQGCGDCWAFATVGTAEAKYNIQEGNSTLDIDLSEQYLVSDCCSAGSCNFGSSAFYCDVSDEACYPYQGGDSLCSGRCADWNSRLWNISDSHNIPNSGDWENLQKSLIMEKGPLFAVMNADTLQYDIQSQTWTCSSDNINHTVVLVGWDDVGGYWIIKNSWGTGWSSNGYGKIKYGECNLAASLYLDSVISP